MKIRKKTAKLPKAARPLFLVGYPIAPEPADLMVWFDREYGGPLRLAAPADNLVRSASHGPWAAGLIPALPLERAELLKEQLGWSHPSAGSVLPAAMKPGMAADLVLFAARLARGLTLLGQGTAYDVVAHRYLNPSDWLDRRLDRFDPEDHVVTDQEDCPETASVRYVTRGLEKFGLDELETVRPVGLPEREPLELLRGAAEELIKIGVSPKVGATFSLPSLGLTVLVARHRTAQGSQGPVSIREIVAATP